MKYLRLKALALAIACFSSVNNPAFADTELEAASQYFEQVFKGECDTLADLAKRQGARAATPQQYTIMFKRPYSETPEKFVLFQFLCRKGAYNSVHVFVAKQYEALLPVSFSQPTYDVVYKDGGERDVKEIKLSSYGATNFLINAHYDEATKQITSYSKSRGIGDAYTSGVWIFKQGRFELGKYEIDASYDEKASPQMILNYGVASE